MIYFGMSNVGWLCLRKHDLFCGGEFCEALRKDRGHMLL